MTRRVSSATISRQSRKTASHGSRLIALLTSTALISANLFGAPALAGDLPTGGSVSAGSATIGTSGSNGLVINQTSGSAVINWQSYNIGQGNTVTYVQPNANSAILNRVTGSATTTIAGQLSANGQVYIVNPNGIAITSTGTINTGAFVASTLDISDDDFMSGTRTFTGNGVSNAVTNAGRITIDRGGYMALIGGSVENSGTIIVPMGNAALGSGEHATLDVAGDGFLQVAIPTSAEGSKALVSNSGKISANGGAVQLTAAAARDMARQAVNMSGTIEAKGVSGKNGDITLFGGDGEVVVSGRIDASNATGSGGKVTATGRKVTFAKASIDASGHTGGGTVLVGGERQGKGTLKHAETLSVDDDTVINADAVSTGNGGDVVLWSDYQTGFAGTILARGGEVSGNGGEVEVSGKALLSYTGLTDLSAANGSFGNLLLDPYNVTISTGSDTGGFTASGNDSVINVNTLATALSLANVTVTTGDSSSAGMQAGNINVTAPLSWSAATTLTLTAANNIDIEAAINAASGGLTLNSGGTISATAAVSIGGIFNLASGSMVQSASTLPDFYAHDFQINGGSFLRVTGGDGTGSDPYQITDIYGIQGIGSSSAYRAASWALAGNIDASGTADWNDGLGFDPIGDSTSAFTGSFDGGDHAITGLTISRSSTDYVGLFGYAGSGAAISNIGLVGGSFGGSYYVGALAGSNSGAISNAYTTGTVSGTNYWAGGLVGTNSGTITNAYTTGTVSGTMYVGGLVGWNSGAITNAYAAGAISGGHDIGGFVGSNYYLGMITNAYATGAVSGTGVYVGGFAGNNNVGGAITNAYATGSVSGTGSYVGGFVGLNSGTITVSFFDENTTGRSAGVGSGSTSGVIGLTTAESRSSSSYSGWDFSTVWYQTGDMRPILRSEAATADTNGAITITNLHQLALIGLNLSGNYKLVADIDARETSGTDASGIWSTNGWVPIGTSSRAFTGTFDGAGHTITRLTITRPSTDYVGLFGYAGSVASISNIGLVGGSISGRDEVGGLAGLNAGTISNAYFTGAIGGSGDVGGLVGWNYSGTISNAYATGTVSGTSSVGGLLGYNYSGVVSNAYATGLVSGYIGVGGLAGVLNAGTISNAYATGAVSGSSDVGGLVGLNESGTISTSFWDIYTTGQADGCGYSSGICSAIGLSTVQMSDPFRFIDADWDFASTWAVVKTGGAPVLRSLTTDAVYNYYVRLSGDTTVTYGDTASTSGIAMDGAGASYVTVGWGSAISASTSAGTYAYADENVVAFSYSTGTAGDYYIDYGSNGLTVNKRALTVTADALSKTYGDVNPTLTYTVTGLVNNDSLSGALSTSAGQYSNVGTYGITLGSLANNNYSISYTGANLTIGQRALTITADALTRTYGEVNPTLTYTATGLVNGDTLTGTLATSATQYSNVGNYDITLGTLANSNYAISYTGAKLTIGQRALTVTADALSKIYGDVNPTLTYTATGLVNSDTLSGSLTTSAGQYSNVGNYGITIGTLANSNYAISYTGANLTVGARTLTVTADALSKPYGDINPALTYSVSGLVNGDTLSGSLVTSAGRYSDVGDYGITIGTLANSNYAISYTGAKLTIGQRALTITADALTRTYGDANPTLTYTATGLVNGDTLSGALATSATRYSDVGAYAINQGTLANSNYAITYAGANLTIGARTLTVTADALSKTYGEVNPTLTYTAAGLVNGDTLSGSLATSATQYANVGGYAIGQGTLAASNNYVINYTGADLTIGARAITVAADAASRIYGDINPALTYTATGLVNGDTLTGALTTSADRYSNVGSYAIGRGTLANANYDITYTGANLTVTLRAITVAADDLSRFYGAANPNLTWTVGGMGLINGDTLSGSLTTTATRTSPLGQYDITQGTLMASANYALTFDPGTLTVEARLAMPTGTFGSDLGKAFDTVRFSPPPVFGGMENADGVGMLMSDPRFDDTVICLDGGGCTAVPPPTLH